jgi:hypothetical protein
MLHFINKLKKRGVFRFPIDPIIIYQPGKVGSSTLLDSLQYSLYWAAIYHAHHLNDLEQMEADIKARYSHSQKPLRKLGIDWDLRRKIDKYPNQKWSVINLTREPVARIISTVFQMLDVIFPGWKEKYQAGELDLHQMQDIIVNRYVIGPGSGDWYDTQLKPVFDIDVYAQPFPHPQGHEIYYGKNNSRLLVIRLEDLNRVGQTVLSDFLNLNEFQLVQANISEQKEYSDLYREFKKLPLPASYLEKMYSSKYARHFYTDEELHGFYQKWIAGQNGSPGSSL